MSHYASILATKAFDLAVAGFGTRFKTYRKTPALQVRPDDLPMLGIYILRETREAWGAANHAEPKFNHMLTLGFSGAVHGETDEQNQLLQLEEWMSELDDILLRNPKFVILTGGVQSMDRQSQYAKVGETTLYEIRVEMVIPFQSNFPPKVEDDLETIHVETRYPSADTDPAAVMQIKRVYEMDQNS
jgi:hypothetical protein